MIALDNGPVFIKQIMADALEEHDGKVSIHGRNITNLWFADDIEAAGSNSSS